MTVRSAALKLASNLLKLAKDSDDGKTSPTDQNINANLSVEGTSDVGENLNDAETIKKLKKEKVKELLNEFFKQAND